MSEICPRCGRSNPVRTAMVDRGRAVGPVRYCECPCGNVWEIGQKLQVVPAPGGMNYITAQDGDLIIVTRPDGYSYSTGVSRVLDSAHYIDHHGCTQHIGQKVRDIYRRDPNNTRVEIVRGGMRQVSPSLKVWPRVKDDPMFDLAERIIDFTRKLDDDPWGLLDTMDTQTYVDGVVKSVHETYRMLCDNPAELKHQLRIWEGLDAKEEKERAEILREIDSLAIGKKAVSRSSKPKTRTTAKKKTVPVSKKTVAKNKRR